MRPSFLPIVKPIFSIQPFLRYNFTHSNPAFTKRSICGNALSKWVCIFCKTAKILKVHFLLLQKSPKVLPMPARERSIAILAYLALPLYPRSFSEALYRRAPSRPISARWAFGCNEVADTTRDYLQTFPLAAISLFPLPAWFFIAQLHLFKNFIGSGFYLSHSQPTALSRSI